MSSKNGKQSFLKNLSRLERQALSSTKRELMYELVGQLVEKEVRSLINEEKSALRARVRKVFREELEKEIPLLVKKAVKDVRLYLAD